MSVCTFCHYACTSCSGPSNSSCSSCTSGFFKNLDDTICDSTCPDGQYTDIIGNPSNCMRCDLRCLTCNVTNCFTCAAGFNIPYNSIRCVLNCPALNYYDINVNKCLPCYLKCYSCYNST